MCNGGVMMRLLHTSDWHLGATLHGVSCDPDHRRFIQWLVETLDSESIDVVVVVGNIFDLAQPSAEAQSLFYEFLALASATRVRRIVVVGGNHDSATRLDATRPVMEALKIHIVGGLSADEASWEQALCPVHNSDGALLGVVAAVPYVHEFRLGVRTTSGDVRGMAEATRRGFKHLYTTLADGAAARFPDVPLVATGHLTCSGAGDDDYGTPIHQVASIGGLPPEVFDPRFDYVALGHVHRSFQVGPGPVWYSGSPIPLKLHDMAAPRRVLLVEVATSTETRVSPLEVPVFRELLAVEGDADSVAERIATVQSPAPFGPLI
ncbi:MAG: exonuclease SbcD, partial [Myxococcota bacterium]